MWFAGEHPSFVWTHLFPPSHRSRGRLSEPLFLSSSICFWSRSCSFFSLSSTSLSLAAVSTGLAAPNIEEVLLEFVVLLWGDKLPLCSSSFGMLRGFRFNLGLCVGPGMENLLRLESGDNVSDIKFVSLKLACVISPLAWTHHVPLSSRPSSLLSTRSSRSP